MKSLLAAIAILATVNNLAAKEPSVSTSVLEVNCDGYVDIGSLKNRAFFAEYDHQAGDEKTPHPTYRVYSRPVIEVVAPIAISAAVSYYSPPILFTIGQKIAHAGLVASTPPIFAAGYLGAMYKKVVIEPAAIKAGIELANNTAAKGFLAGGIMGVAKVVTSKSLDAFEYVVNKTVVDAYYSGAAAKVKQATIDFANYAGKKAVDSIDSAFQTTANSVDNTVRHAIRASGCESCASEVKQSLSEKVQNFSQNLFRPYWAAV